MLSKRTLMQRAVSMGVLLTLLAPYAAAAPKKKAEPAAAAAPAPTPPAQPPLSESLTGMGRAEYEAAKILYADGDYAGAALKFQRAYEESKDPRLLWNQAAAEKNLRRYVKVTELVERYIRESGDKLTEQDRADAQALLDTVKTFICDVTFKIVPDGAAVFIDEQQIGTSPLTQSLRVEMGERKVRVSKPGFLDYTASRQFDGGSAATVDVTLQAEVHEGKLLITASPGDTIRVDGAVVGTGEWQGNLQSGLHRVQVSAPGKRDYQSDVAVQDKQSHTVRVVLDPIASAGPAAQQKPEEDSGGGGGWLWVGGGLLVAAGLGVGAYFLFKPKDEPAEPVSGTLDPGVYSLSF